MNAVPQNPAAWKAWVASLPETELETVYQTVLAAAELRTLADLVGAGRANSTAAAPPITTVPHPMPRPGTIHPYFGWREVKKWILVGIASRGGSAPTAEIIDFVYANICNELLPEDLETTDETTELRWRNRVRWERENLADEGYLHRGPRGVWTLTEKARRLMDLR
jgi:hypothetical protein